MKANNSYDFLADENKYSNAFAVQYAYGVGRDKCWKTVLNRGSLVFDEALYIVCNPLNRELLIHILDNKDYDPIILVNTLEMLHPKNDAIWATLFMSEKFIEKIGDLSVKQIFENFSVIKNEMFRKYLDDLLNDGGCIEQQEITVEDYLEILEDLKMRISA